VPPVSSQACPECGASLPLDPRYVTWCHGCGWNLRGPEAQEAEGRFERLLASVGRRLGDRMANELAESGRLEPRLTPSRAAAYAIAVLVHAFALGLVVAGIWLLVEGSLFPKIAGGLLLGLAYLMRPRLGRRARENRVARADAPALYAYADEVAQSVGARPPHVIVLSTDFNASWSVRGLRRERTLELGLPLLAVLDPDEITALVAHELAHGRNGDATRGLVVGSAIAGLSELYFALTAEEGGGNADLELVELVAKPFAWLLAQPIRLVLLLELHLTLQDARRAEYLADRIAARVAGPRAQIGLDEKLMLAGSLETAVQRFAHAQDALGGDVFDAMRAAVADVPERERERRRRLARLEGTRLGATHPPTAKRIELIERLTPSEREVRLDAERWEAILAELAADRKRLSRRIVEGYRAAVFG
jgi:Zn-dependent protease with chaperone function